MIDLSDILAYADDILVLCDDQATLQKCIHIIEKWSAENNLRINKNKSAVLEFIHRSKRVTVLKVGAIFEGYPIVDEYKYLGTWFNQKLTLSTQLQHILKNTYFIRNRLSPVLYNASLDLRKNLWQVFVLPMYEFIIPLYCNEKAKTKRQLLEKLLRKSFKSYTGLKKTVDTNLINDMMGYNLEDRSGQLQYISEQKWRCRQLGQLYNHEKGSNVGYTSKTFTRNLCKNMPKTMVKYINMQTSLCLKCKELDITTRCSKDHLGKTHKTVIETVHDVTQKTYTFMKERQKILKKFGDVKEKIKIKRE